MDRLDRGLRRRKRELRFLRATGFALSECLRAWGVSEAVSQALETRGETLRLKAVGTKPHRSQLRV